MKKVLFLFVIILFSCHSNSQNNIDALFNRYSGREGFMTLSLSSDLLRLFNVTINDEREGKDCSRWSANVREIRLLIQKDDDIRSENFYESTIRGIEKNRYEEFMRINESDQDLIMFVRAQGNVISEFLVIAGGDDNLLIQVRGSMTKRDARCFSDNLKGPKGTRIFADIH